MFTSANAFAQKIGLHVGKTYANMYDKKKDRELDKYYESIWGIDIGLDLKIDFSENLSILTGISYYQNGFHEDARTNGYTRYYEKNVRLNYLKFPVSFFNTT